MKTTWSPGACPKASYARRQVDSPQLLRLNGEQQRHRTLIHSQKTTMPVHNLADDCEEAPQEHQQAERPQVHASKIETTNVQAVCRPLAFHSAILKGSLASLSRQLESVYFKNFSCRPRRTGAATSPAPVGDASATTGEAAAHSQRRCATICSKSSSPAPSILP